MWLNSFNYFRALAILSIVANHSLPISGWQIDTAGERFFANLVIGGSTLFVFISGFLFHHVHYPRFSYLPFLQRKFRNIFIPYLFLSIPPIIYFVFFKTWAPHQELFFTGQPDLYHAYLRPILMYLATGSVIASFWYIPFIMTVFVFSPLLVAFIKWRPAARITTVVLLLIHALFVQCPVGNLLVPQWVAYHLPTFLLGIVVSIHRDFFYRLLHAREGYLLLLTLLFAWLQARYYPGYGSLHKAFFQPALPDVQMLQKICLSFFLIIYLHRYESSSFTPLAVMAETSFAIYFLHSFVLYGMERLFGLLPVSSEWMQGPVLWLVLTVLVTLACMGLARVCRSVLRSHSRLLIGY